MLMIRMNIPLQISTGIFVYGKIIEMHTILESNYTVIKLQSNGNSKVKNINKKQFNL